MNPSCTDDEFIELMRTHKSIAAVARVLGISERAVYARRSKIERRYRIVLDGDSRGVEYHKQFRPKEHAARKQFSCPDGVVLVFSDAHFWPGVRTTAFRALLTFIEHLKPKAVICNGDAFDGASISRYPRIGWDSKPSVIQELKACRDSLEIIQDASKDAKLYWPLGNHDARFENRLAQNSPEFEGVKGFSLKDHFPAWEPCWSVWINDEVVVKHRFKNGIHATHNNTVTSGKTIVTGHLHSLKVTPFTDYTGDRWGVDTGTLADPLGPQFVDYLEDSPTNWRSGFAVLTFHKGGLLWPELAHVVSQSQVAFRGMVLDV